MPVNTGMGVGGIPDFICCYHGHLLAIEAKSDRGTPTERHLDRHVEIRAAHGTVLVIHDVEQLRRWYDEVQ